MDEKLSFVHYILLLRAFDEQKYWSIEDLYKWMLQYENTHATKHEIKNAIADWNNRGLLKKKDVNIVQSDIVVCSITYYHRTAYDDPEDRYEINDIPNKLAIDGHSKKIRARG